MPRGTNRGEVQMNQDGMLALLACLRSREHVNFAA